MLDRRKARAVSRVFKLLPGAGTDANALLAAAATPNDPQRKRSTDQIRLEHILEQTTPSDHQKIRSSVGNLPGGCAQLAYDPWAWERRGNPAKLSAVII
jgi:hypothetical protein